MGHIWGHADRSQTNGDLWVNDSVDQMDHGSYGKFDFVPSCIFLVQVDLIFSIPVLTC